MVKPRFLSSHQTIMKLTKLKYNCNGMIFSRLRCLYINQCILQPTTLCSYITRNNQIKVMPHIVDYINISKFNYLNSICVVNRGKYIMSIKH